MKTVMRFTASLLLCAFTSAQAYDFDDWPVHYTFGDGTDIGLTGAYRYDIDRFGNDRLPNGSDAFQDAATNRRKEVGLILKKKGVYDAIVAFEYQSKTWLDVFLRLQSSAFLGADYGAFRFGYSKTPAGFEGVTATRANEFLELALPIQALYEGRRTGVDWAFERPGYIVNAGYYWGKDLLGDNHGTTVAGRVAWTPHKAVGDVLHLGFAASREDRSNYTDGRGIVNAPSVRFSTPPEAGLTTVRLVDTGTLSRADRVERAGFEGLWIDGPWSLQGEWLRARVSRQVNPDFTAKGFYMFGSWVLTGESRPYVGGNTGNITPAGRYGAWELLLRYSELDLDSDGVAGGRQHDWTLGANWYLTKHFKFQANYIFARADKPTLTLDPRIFEVRAQIQF